MKYIIKYAAHTGLAGSVIYAFYINGELLGIWPWILAIVVSILVLGNYYILIGAHVSYPDDPDEGKVELITAGFIDFLICTAVFFKTIYAAYTDWLFILFIFVLLLLSSGINRRTWSFIFLGFTIYIFSCENCCYLNNWHGCTIFIILIIINVICSVVIITDKISSNHIPKYELIGIIIPIILIAYIWFVNYDYLMTERNRFLLYTYFITAFLVSIRDNITACSFISVISVIYLLLYKSDYDTYILIVIGTLSFECFILNKKNLSFISLLIAYNKQIVNKHNNLVDKYGNLVDKYNNLVDKYNNEEINPKGDDITNSVEKGFWVEMGKQIGKTIWDWL